MKAPRPLQFFSLSIPLVAVLAVAALLAFPPPYAYYLEDSGNREAELKLLLGLMDHESTESPIRFSLVNKISGILADLGERPKANLFLLSSVDAHPQDPFNAYYLFQIAENYRLTGAPRFASSYYERLINNHADLLYQGESIRYQALRRLSRLAPVPAVRLKAFDELLSGFSDRAATSETYYYLGQTLEDLGKWSQAIQTYSTYLAMPNRGGFGNNRTKERIRSLVDFYHSDKSWVWRDLPGLIASVKKGVLDEDSASLDKLRAQVNFFARSWDSQETYGQSQEAFDPGAFMHDILKYSKRPDDSRINFESDPGSSTNENEVFVKTTGWFYRQSTWYFYFHKVDFPPDPEINGSWEWAGVYFGERP